MAFPRSSNVGRPFNFFRGFDTLSLSLRIRTALPLSISVGYPETGLLESALFVDIDLNHRSALLQRKVERQFGSEYPGTGTMRPA
jgi:hypothetical protein